MVADGRVLIGIALGAVMGFAFVQLARGGGSPSARRRVPSPRAVNWLVGIGSGLALAVLTGWPLLGVAGGFLIAQMLQGFREQRLMLTRRAELARFASSLRDACLAGHAMADAVRIAAANAGPAIRADMVALSSAVQQVGVGQAFAAYARRAPDPLFRVLAVMVGEADRQGRDALSGLLTRLARQTSREVAANRESGAEQGAQRATAPIVGMFAVGLLAMRPGRTAIRGRLQRRDRQVAMAAGLVPIGIGYLLMVRTQRRTGRSISLAGAVADDRRPRHLLAGLRRRHPQAARAPRDASPGPDIHPGVEPRYM